MNTSILTQENPEDVLLEFVEILANIEVSPEKIKQNSGSMVGADGEIIVY